MRYFTSDFMIAVAIIGTVIAMMVLNSIVNSSLRSQLKSQAHMAEMLGRERTMWFNAHRALMGQTLCRHSFWEKKNLRLRNALITERKRAEGYKAMLDATDALIAGDDELFIVGARPLAQGEAGRYDSFEILHPDVMAELRGVSPIVGANGESLPNEDLRGIRPESELWVGGQRVG